MAVLLPVLLGHVHLQHTFTGYFCVSHVGMRALFCFAASRVPKIESHTCIHFLRKYFKKNLVLNQSVSALAKKCSTQDLEAEGKLKQVGIPGIEAGKVSESSGNNV